VLESSGLVADTIAGLILEIAGKLPRKNEIINLVAETGEKNFQFKMESVDKRRINRVKITVLDKSPAELEQAN